MSSIYTSLKEENSFYMLANMQRCDKAVVNLLANYTWCLKTWRLLKCCIFYRYMGIGLSGADVSNNRLPG